MSDLTWIVDSLTNHTEKGTVADIFLELPSEEDYPDYYKVIKNPVALDTIQEKIDNGDIITIEELKQDFDIMIQNAFTFNRKGSIVYKDAQHMSKLFDEYVSALENLKSITKQGLLFLSKTLDSVDESTKNMIEKQEKNEYSEKVCVDFIQVQNAIFISEIKTKLSNYTYTTISEFIEDVELLVSNMKTIGMPGSVLLQDAETITKLISDVLEDDDTVPDSNSTKNPTTEEVLDQITVNGDTLVVGDYVYIHNPEMPTIPTIGQIYHIWKESKKNIIRVCWFLRPEQTKHKLLTRFIEKEVFKTNHFENYLDSEIIGRCHVQFVKDYVRGKCVGIDCDVYVCESRYNIQNVNSSKIKNWASCLPESVRDKKVELDFYKEPLVLKRAPLDDETRAAVLPTPSKRKRDIDDDVPSSLPKRRAAAINIKYGVDQDPPSPPVEERFTRSEKKSQFVLTIPHKTESLSKDQIALLDKRGDGTVRWFTSPPIDIIDPDPIQHTKEYLKFKKSRPIDMVVDETTPAAAESVEEEIQQIEMEQARVEPSDSALFEFLLRNCNIDYRII